MRSITVALVLSTGLLAACPAQDSVSCGEGTILVGDLCLPEDNGPGGAVAGLPMVESARLLELVLPHEDEPLMLHYPVPVHARVEVTGEDAFVSLHVSLDTPDGEQGCVIGSFPVAHIAPFDSGGVQQVSEPRAYDLTATFAVPEACAPVSGRDDLVLRVSFDTFATTEYAMRVEPPGLADTVEPSLWEMTLASPLDASACEAPGTSHPDTCDVPIEVLPSPGLDVELASLELVNSVGLLRYSSPIPGSTEPPPEIPGGRHLSATVNVQSWGYPDDVEHDPDSLALTAELRPVPGGQGTDGLAGEDLGWVPMHLRSAPAGGGDGYDLGEYHAFGEVPHTVPHYRDLDLDFAGDIHDMLVDGVWADIVEFTLRVCVLSEEEQADLGGTEYDDDCLSKQVIVVRHHETHDINELSINVDGLGGEDARDFGPESGLHESYGKHWSIEKGNRDSAYFGAGAGWSIGTSRGLQAHSIIDRVPFAAARGGWAGAGAWAEAVFFNQVITFFEVGTYLLDYTDQTDIFHLRATLFGIHKVPRLPGGWELPDGVLMLNDLLNLMGGSYEAEFTFDWPIPNYAVKAEVPCGSVKAGAFVVLTAGMDPFETTLTKSSNAPGGSACDDPEGLGSVPWGDHCTVVYDLVWPLSRADAVEFCTARGGALPPAVSNSHLDGIAALYSVDGLSFLDHQHQWAFQNSGCDQSSPRCWGVGGLDSKWSYPSDPGFNWMAGYPSSRPLVEPYGMVFNDIDAPFGIGELRSVAVDTGWPGYPACAYPDEEKLGGTTWELVLTPHVGAGLAALVDVEFEATFATVSFELRAELDVLDLSFPATTTFAYDFHPTSITGAFSFGINEKFETLSGEVTATIGWKTSGLIFDHSGSHVKLITKWEGLSTEVPLVPTLTAAFHVP